MRSASSGSSLAVRSSGLQPEVSAVAGNWTAPDADMDFLEAVVHSVIVGRVVGVSAVDRSRVEVTLADGTVAVEVGSSGFRSLLPKPGWQRRGTRTEYAPYTG